MLSKTKPFISNYKLVTRAVTFLIRPAGAARDGQGVRRARVAGAAALRRRRDVFRRRLHAATQRYI